MRNPNIEPEVSPNWRVEAEKAFLNFHSKLPEMIREDALVKETWEFMLEKAGSDYAMPNEFLWQHALSVAEIVVEMVGLGAPSVCAAFLHELMVDGRVTDKELTTWLNPTIINILSGLRKAAAIRTDRTAFQSENFIKLLLTVATDVRVALIRLADRLHHLRCLDQLPSPERETLVNECSFIYAPVAHRLGLYNIKTELEDHSMRILEPDAYNLVSQKLRESRSKQKVLIEDFIRPIEKELMRNGFDFEVKWRTKSIPSIWRKMKSQQVEFEQVYDVFAVRVILTNIMESEKADAWKVYSLITDIYPPNPARLRDWISAPKASGYESLHTTVFGPGKRWIEVQIRSKRMDEVAEKGHASHWSYKDHAADVNSTDWLNSIRELLEAPAPDAFENAHKAKTDLYSDKIFIFTPEGDLRKLNAGSTVLDFAYEIHTRIGNQCVGAKINGKNATIKQKLENGDSVEILTSKNQQPKSDWLGYVMSPKAKARIKRALKDDVRQEAALGKAMVERKFKNWKMAHTEEQISKILKEFHFKDSLEFYSAVASEKVDLHRIKDFLKERSTSLNVKGAPISPISLPISGKSSHVPSDDDVLEIDKSLGKVTYTLAPCCNPIFGDDVFGFITVSKGVTVHRINCPNAADLVNKYPYRIVEVKWRKSSGLTSYQATIKVVGFDELGIVNQISEVISTDMKVNMRAITFESNAGRFEGLITLNVFDTQHLEALIRKIQKIKGVTKVARSEGE